jgi:hypothetical protein
MTALVHIASFDADYGDGRGPLKGASHHPQVYTSRGFTCDSTIRCVIEAVWGIGFETTRGSCENTNDTTIPKWMIPRSRVAFTHADPHILLRFCLHLKEHLASTTGWDLDMCFAGHTPKAYAEITFKRSLQQAVLLAMKSFEIHA